GWFTFYVMKMPAEHGMEARFITTFFVADLSRALALTIATAALLFTAAQHIRARISTPVVAFGAYLLSGFLASASSRMHLGGWVNVLMFWTVFACPAVAWVLARAHEKIESNKVFACVLAGLALQAGAFAPDPNDSVPNKKDAAYAQSFQDRIRALEANGEVV